MLNEDKIRLMNEIAVFEKKEGKKAVPAEKYFESDFVARRMMQSFFAFTLCYILIMVVAVLYNMEILVSSITMSALVNAGRKMIVLYAAGLFLFELVTWFVCGKQYRAAEEIRKRKLSLLNRLGKRYELQDKARELAKEGGRNV